LAKKRRVTSGKIDHEMLSLKLSKDVSKRSKAENKGEKKGKGKEKESAAK